MPSAISISDITGSGATAVNPMHASYELLRRADFNPMGYTPSIVLTVIALVLILFVAFSQTFCMHKWGPRWMLSLVIGEYCFAVGFVLRFVVRANPDSIAIFAIENMFIILSPCAFIAADYVLLGRLARHLEAEKHLLVPAQKITKYFVISDVVTFFVQASGGGLSAIATSAVLGSRIFLIGLILQLVSFSAFIVVYATFLYRVRMKEPRIWNQDQRAIWYEDWRALAFALCISCFGILVRSFYRVIELSEGYHGYLATTEGYFYGLDTLPLLVAISIFTPFWPGRFISESTSYTYDSNIQLDGVA